MLRRIRIVYDRQRAVVAGGPEGEAAFERGFAQLTNIFGDCLVENVVDRVRATEWRRALRSARLLVGESPERLATAVRRLFRAGRRLTHRFVSAGETCNRRAANAAHFRVIHARACGTDRAKARPFP